MSAKHEHNAPSTTGYGFEDIMAAAMFEDFPVWYAERCLLSNTLSERPGADVQPSEEVDVPQLDVAA